MVERENVPQISKVWKFYPASKEDMMAAVSIRVAVFGIGDLRGTSKTINIVQKRVGNDIEIVGDFDKKEFETLTSEGNIDRLNVLVNASRLDNDFILQALVLGYQATGIPLTPDLAELWKHAEDKKGRGLRRKKKHSIDSTINAHGGLENSFEKSKQFALYFTDITDTLFATTALDNLKHFTSISQIDRYNLDTPIKRWAKNIRELCNDESLSDRELYDKKRKLFTAIRQKLTQVSHQAKATSDEERQALLTIGKLNDLYTTWTEVSIPSIKLLDEITEVNDQMRDGKGIGEIVFEAHNKKEMPVVKEPEAVFSAQEQEDIVLHIQELSEKRVNIYKSWQTRRQELKEKGFDELTHRFVTGDSGESIPGVRWEVNGVPKEDANSMISFLFQCQDSLRREGFESTKRKFYRDVFLQDALFHDVQRISRWAKEQLPSINGQLPQSENAQLRGVLERLRNDWTNYRQVISKYWPKDIPVDLPALEALIKSEPITIFNHPEPDFSESGSEQTELTSSENPSSVLKLNPVLTETAIQLDWEVLPEGSFEKVKESILQKYPRHQINKIDWKRIEDLVAIRNDTRGKMYRSKRKILGAKTPYFVVTFNLENKAFAIAENPQVKNATFILREDLIPGTWDEVLKLRKKPAEDVGAMRIVHAVDSKDHLQKIQTALQDLATIQ